jgi:hypothetical protein
MPSQSKLLGDLISAAGTVTVNGSNLVANTVANSAFQTGSVENYFNAQGLPIGRNRIINGNMQISQRGTSFTVDGVNTYSLDRWQVEDATDGVFTVTQSSDAPSGFVNSLLVTVTTADASIGASQYALVRQRIEGLNATDLGWGTASAQTVTLSFWVKSSLTGTFGGVILNSAANRSYPYTYTISSANTWEKKSITIPGDTTGTWLTTNGIFAQVDFNMAAGSTYLGTANAWSGNTYLGATGQTQIMSTLNATWYVTGVQLEIGTTATPFERRLYGQELINCQRYYQQYDASENSAAGGGLAGVCGSTSIAVVTGILPVEMRTTPSFNFNNLVINYGGAVTVVTTTAGFYSGKKAIGMDITGTGTPLTVGRAAVIQFTSGQSAANRWFLSAEL